MMKLTVTFMQAFAIAQSVCVGIQISRGLAAVDPTQLDVLLKVSL